MRMNVKIAAIAIVLVGIAGAANAFEIGDVVVGYSDGYTGHDNQFHAWEHRADAEAYRSKHGDEYRAWKHDDSRHHDNH
jgi:hypothetical protein